VEQCRIGLPPLQQCQASRTPEQAGMQLLAVPVHATYAEYIFLKGRRVLADQMEYLIGTTSPVRAGR